MRAVVQRVHSARVVVDQSVVGEIGRGLVVFVGAASGDTEQDLAYLVNKVVGLRVFPDDTGRMTRALPETDGQMLIVSQFTVIGDVRRGMRPSFDDAMSPELAEPFYERFVLAVRARGVSVATGRFRAHMNVLVDNDGPVTILIDSKRTF